jgi:hypothetical protein
MSVEYINRKGDVYYLHVGKTRTGKPKFFFSRTPSDAPVCRRRSGSAVNQPV